MSIDLEEPPSIPPSERQYLDHIPCVDVNTISYSEFFKQYILTNQACMITNVSSDWNCTNKWITKDRLNVEYLYLQYGECDVTVYDCQKKHYNSQETKERKFMHYLTYLEAYMETGYSEKFPILYLKDWHLKDQHPHDDFYEVPEYFKSDWLNEYLVNKGSDDYRFVYIGPKGSWTPFHADVFKSYSWSVNVFGQKRWILLPPGQEDLLRDNLGNLPYDIDDKKDKVKHFEVIQNASDAIFVPSGWYHKVWNLETTISVNHNWFNGCNIRNVWMDLKLHLKSVFKEIDDCKDMEGFLEQAQVVLKASYGMDFDMFYNIVSYIAEERMKILNDKTFQDLHDESVVFDLKCVSDVLDSFVQDEDVKNLDVLYDKIDKSNLCDRIRVCISKYVIK